MLTHTALVTVSIGAPLQTLQVPTVKPESDEVRVMVEWTEIMLGLLAQGVVQLNRIKIVEDETLLERAQWALDALRRKENSDERLVWRVVEEE